MIAKMSRGSDARGLAAYLHGPGRANEHTFVRGGKTFSGGVVIGGTVPVADIASGKGWANDFTLAHRQRPRVVKNVWHASLRADPTDRRLGDGEWFQIGQQLADTLGYGSHPWVMVRHADDHVHIAVSRVSHDGSVWKASHDYRSVRPVIRAAEERFGLRRVPDLQQEPGPKTGLTQGEERRARRTHTVPGRAQLALAVRAAADLAAGHGREQFERELATLGVGYRLNQSPTTGRINGYSFTNPKHLDSAGQPVWFTASSIDRGLAWSKLAVHLDGPALHSPVRAPAVEPKKRFESKTSFESRCAAAAQSNGRAVFRRDRVHAARDEHTRHAAFWRGQPEIDPAKTAANKAAASRAEHEHAAALARMSHPTDIRDILTRRPQQQSTPTRSFRSTPPPERDRGYGR